MGLPVLVGFTQSCLVWPMYEVYECSVVSNGLEDPGSRVSVCFKRGRKDCKITVGFLVH